MREVLLELMWVAIDGAAWAFGILVIENLARLAGRLIFGADEEDEDEEEEEEDDEDSE